MIFQGGLTWDLIHKRWPNFQEAFANFSIEEVANFDDEDLSRLLEDEGIIRNSQKIEATLYNAKEFQTIIEEFGSFDKYLDSLDKPVEEKKTFFSSILDRTRKQNQKETKELDDETE